MALGAFALRIDKHPNSLSGSHASAGCHSNPFRHRASGNLSWPGNQWLSDLDKRDYLSGNDWQLLEPYSKTLSDAIPGGMHASMHTWEEGSDVGRLRQLNVHFWVNRKPEFDGGERHGRTHTWEREGTWSIS